MARKKYYSVWHFLWDGLMVTATCGIWIIWIIIREMQMHN